MRTGGESIFLKGKVIGRDHRDRPVYGDDTEIKHCVISPAGDQVVKGDDFVHGDISKLQVLAPPYVKGEDGTLIPFTVKDGDVVVIRGEEYTVQQRKSFDYSVGRRPALRRHKPKVMFVVERGEVSDGVA